MQSSGSEAIARGAVEAGVSVVASYPGEPVSIPVEILAREAKKNGMHVEWSINEKVAYEVALGSSYAGLRSAVFVKHVGFNWIMDPFVGSAYTGVKGGLVIVVGDDPGGTGSTNEEDTRYLTEVAEVPLLEPSTPEECREMVVDAFELSEEFRLPVVVRVVTRLCREIGPVKRGMISAKASPSFGEKWFVKERLLHQHQEIHRKNLELEKASELSGFNRASIPRGAKVGIIGCGSAFRFGEDLAESNPGRIALLKVGFVRPLPVKKVSTFISSCDKVLVVEEVQPYLEAKVRQTVRGSDGIVYGKMTGHIPWAGPLSHELLARAVQGVTGWLPEGSRISAKQSVVETTTLFDFQPCVGGFDQDCPHRSTFTALRSALKRAGVSVTVVGDVGCMSLDLESGDPVADSMTCMGASPSVAAGLKIARPERRVIAVIGDSSFYHSGLQGTINNLRNETRVITLILDNMITAQSGFQPDLGTPTAKKVGESHAPLEELLRVIGARVLVVDSFKPGEVEEALVDALTEDQSVVIVSRGRCPIADKAGAYSSVMRAPRRQSR